MTAVLASPARLLWILSAALVFIAVWVSPGFFIIDEIIYFLGIDAVARTGGFAVENGFDTFQLNDFKIWLLQPGTEGIVSQYPAGSAWAGAVLVPVLGGKALIALNVAAGIGTLFVTHALARSLFQSEKAAILAVVLLALFSFWPEYVFAHWPHSVSVFCTTLALLLFLRAMPRETGAFVPAVLSGLAIGGGMLFRLDGVLLAPSIAVITLLWAVRPVQVLAGGAVGLSPMIAVLAATNHAKFGSWNPLSYGVSGGGTDLAGHTGTGIAMLAAIAGLILLRRLPPIGPRGRRVLAVALLVGVAGVLLSPLAPYVWRLLRGVWAILFDATAINDPRPGIQRQPDGTLLYWGLPKKALFQSLPWLGVLAFLVGVSRDAPRRAVPVVLIVSIVWAMPFLALSWHGGLGSNMRYLLPVLPALAALSAWTLLRLGEGLDNAPQLVRVGIPVSLGLALLLRVAAPETLGQVHQIYSTYLFLAIFGLSLAAGLTAWPPLTKATLVMAGAGLGLGLFLSASDLAAGQIRRASNDASSRATAGISGPVIFYGPPEMYANAIGDPERLLAISFPPGGGGDFDPELVQKACAYGYRVVMWDVLARTTGLPSGRFATLALPELTIVEQLVEITCD